MIKDNSQLTITSYAAVPLPNLTITTVAPHKASRVECLLGSDDCKICFLVIDGELHRQEIKDVVIQHNDKVYKGRGFQTIMDELPDGPHVYQVYGNKGQYLKTKILKIEVL